MSKIRKIKYLFEKEHPTIEDKGREKTHCPWPGMRWRRMPSRERISHLLFSVSNLWTERKVMDIHKRSLIPKVSEKKVKWQFFWIKFSPGHRNYSSWCLNNQKENGPTSWIWAFIFQLGNWGLSSEQLQDPMLNLCRFTCYSWFFSTNYWVQQMWKIAFTPILYPSLDLQLLPHSIAEPPSEKGRYMSHSLTWVGPCNLFNRVIQKCQGASSEALRGLVCSHMPSCASIITIRRACPG